MKNESRNFDLRTVKRNVESGLIKEDDHTKFLKSLPDESNNFETLPFEEEIEEDLDDVESDEESEESLS